MNRQRCKDSGIPPHPGQCLRHPQDVSRLLCLAEALRGAHPGYLHSKKRNRQNTLPWEVNVAQARLSCTLGTGDASSATASRPNHLKLVRGAQDRPVADS